MRRQIIVRGIAFGALLAAALAFTAGAQTGADEPHLLITWRPQVYVPPGYTGRALPTANSRVTASVALIDNGRIADLSGETIYWYVNDKFVEGGANRQTVDFRVPDRMNTLVDLRVNVQSYKGGVLKTVEIPVFSPAVVIDAPFPRRQTPNGRFSVRAVPYFFNLKTTALLAVRWKVNGEDRVSESDPFLLTLESGDVMRESLPTTIGVTVRNPVSLFEASGDEINLNFVSL
jgi:hypothetical protein